MTVTILPGSRRQRPSPAPVRPVPPPALLFRPPGFRKSTGGILVCPDRGFSPCCLPDTSDDTRPAAESQGEAAGGALGPLVESRHTLARGMSGGDTHTLAKARRSQKVAAMSLNSPGPHNVPGSGDAQDRRRRDPERVWRRRPPLGHRQPFPLRRQVPPLTGVGVPGAPSQGQGGPSVGVRPGLRTGEQRVPHEAGTQSVSENVRGHLGLRDSGGQELDLTRTPAGPGPARRGALRGGPAAG